MPFDVDNGLPGVELWFGRYYLTELVFYDISTHVPQWTQVVCKCINDWWLYIYTLLPSTSSMMNPTSFSPLQLAYVVKHMDPAESMHGKLSAVVRYWLCYQFNAKCITLSFGLEVTAAVDSIVGLPTLRQWPSNLNSSTNFFVASKTKLKLSLYYICLGILHQLVY